jgi:hypothetical protein
VTEQPRRFTLPWDIEDDGACFIVRDFSGQALASERAGSLGLPRIC